MRQRKHITWLAIIIASALGSTAHAQTTLRYQFKDGDKLRYVLEQQITTTVTAKEGESESKLNIVWDIDKNVLKVDKSGNAEMQFKITRAGCS